MGHGPFAWAYTKHMSDRRSDMIFMCRKFRRVYTTKCQTCSYVSHRKYVVVADIKINKTLRSLVDSCFGELKPVNMTQFPLLRKRARIVILKSRVVEVSEWIRAESLHRAGVTGYTCSSYCCPHLRSRLRDRHIPEDPRVVLTFLSIISTS